MRGFLLVAAPFAVSALGCGFGTGSGGIAGSDATPFVPGETVAIIEANPDPIETGDAGPGDHPPGPSWSGGPALAIAVASQFSCEIRPDHRLACWGMGSAPPPGEFVSLSVGDNHSCAIRVDGTLLCFGDGASDQDCANRECGQSQAPSGVFQQVSAGALHSCAIADDQRVVCWGAGQSASACTSDQCGQAAPPAGAFAKVVAGYHHSCALALDGTVQCWGEPSEAVAPAGVYKDLIGEAFASCGLLHDDTLECWGEGGYLAPPTPPLLAFRSAALSFHWACGITQADGGLVCWGEDQGGNLNAPRGSFRQVALGYGHGCAIRDDDQVVCWGDNRALQSQPP